MLLIRKSGTSTGGGPEADPVAMPAINNETARAQGAEQSNATAINNEVSRAQAAEANAKYTPGLLGNRPTPAVFGVGWYWATDDNGGTLYHSDGTNWTKNTKGLTVAAGTQLAYAENGALSYDAKAGGNAWADLAGLTIAVPASAGPVKLIGKVYASNVTGTAAVAANATVQLGLFDAANTQYDADSMIAIQVTAAAVTWTRSLYVAYSLPAGFAGGTFKLRGRIAAAAPANWGGITMLSGGIWPPKAWIEAVAE